MCVCVRDDSVTTVERVIALLGGLKTLTHDEVLAWNEICVFIDFSSATKLSDPSCDAYGATVSLNS